MAHARARVEHDVEHGSAGFLMVGEEFTVSGFVMCTRLQWSGARSLQL